MISGRPPERVNFHRVFIPLNSLGGAPTILKANLPAAEPTGYEQRLKSLSIGPNIKKPEVLISFSDRPESPSRSKQVGPCHRYSNLSLSQRDSLPGVPPQIPSLQSPFQFLAQIEITSEIDPQMGRKKQRKRYIQIRNQSESLSSTCPEHSLPAISPYISHPGHGRHSGSISTLLTPRVAPTILRDPLGMPILIDTYFPSILGISFLPRQTMEGGMNLSGQGRSRLIFMKIFLSPCLPPHR